MRFEVLIYTLRPCQFMNFKCFSLNILKLTCQASESYDPNSGLYLEEKERK